MNVREACPADVAAIRAVHRAAIRELGPAAYDDRQVTAWAAGVENADYVGMTDPDTHFVVAESEGDVVGFGSLSFDADEDPGTAEITGVYVDPEAVREGVGTALLTHLEDAARARGVCVLTLEASLNAVPFYEHRGYERVADRDHEFSAAESTGVTGIVVEMRRRLE